MSKRRNCDGSGLEISEKKPKETLVENCECDFQLQEDRVFFHVIIITYINNTGIYAYFHLFTNIKYL